MTQKTAHNLLFMQGQGEIGYLAAWVRPARPCKQVHEAEPTSPELQKLLLLA